MTTTLPNKKHTINNKDLLALQSYITAKDSTQYDHLAQDTILLDFSHSNLKQKHIEIRFDKHATLEDLRQRIHRQTGTPPAFQNLTLKTAFNSLIAEIPAHTDNNRMLGYFNLESGCSVHCTDVDPHSGSRNGQYENVALVEKYRMSDEEYNKRSGTLRDWSKKQKAKDENFTLARHAREHREMMDAKRQHKLGLELPKGFEYDCTGEVCRVKLDEVNAGVSKKDEEVKEEVPGLESVEGVNVGARCEVQPGGRRGKVTFVGDVSEIGSGGCWVGVMFDEPVGKADGSVKGGKRYFEAQPGFGGFVRGKNVTVGDFPERDIMDEFDSDSEDEL